jgi:hypothetical protein
VLSDAATRKIGSKPLGGPIDDTVRGVVEHLTDDLAPDASVVTALDLYKCWNGLLVNEKVVERPPSAAALLRRDPSFAFYQQPPQAGIANLLASEKIRILLQKSLQDCLRVIRLLPHLDELVSTQEEDSVAHL